MEPNNNDYKISFFKPSTELATKNRNLTLWLVSIWVVAIFGFHFILKITCKPTPEKTLISFEKVWENINTNNFSTADIEVFSKTSLAVIGKSSIKANHKEILNNGFSWAIFQLCDSIEKDSLNKLINSLKTINENLESYQDPEYISLKQNIIDITCPKINLEKHTILAKLIPLEIQYNTEVFKEENKQEYAKTMKLYLTHNQSFLTDFKFLGFPFHYFYTSVFLLILFVGLCWVYCYLSDKLIEKHTESNN